MRCVATIRTLRSKVQQARRPHAGAVVEPCSQDLLAQLGYSSQLGQDLLLDRHVFGGRLGGVVVDVGAHDGVTFSNSVFFETQRGWAAWCIEPNPTVFAQLQENRPNATCLQCAVGAEAGTAEFTAVSGYGEMLSGLTAKLSGRHAERIDKEIARHGGTKSTLTVEIRRLDSILREAAVRHIDLLTIDVEGGEMSVLTSLSLAEFQVGAVVVENNYGTRDIGRHMRRQGYQLFARIGWDEVYVPRPMRMTNTAN